MIEQAQVWETKGYGEIRKVLVTRVSERGVWFHDVHTWWKPRTMARDAFTEVYRLWAPRSPHGWNHPVHPDERTLHPMDRKLLNNIHSRSMALYKDKAASLGVDYQAKPSQNVQAIRDAVTDVRDVVGQLQSMDWQLEERLDYVHGTLQALVIALYHTMDDVAKSRREQDDPC
jgi:hypothetical protein